MKNRVSIILIAADGIMCSDENLVGATVLAGDISLTEYYALKIP